MGDYDPVVTATSTAWVLSYYSVLALRFICCNCCLCWILSRLSFFSLCRRLWLFVWFTLWS